MAYLWLRQLLDLLLPELEHLPTGPQGEAQAHAWFKCLLTRFVERGLTTPAQQKNRVVDARNAIRARFGDDHPSLAYVGFDERTWQKINLPAHDRTEARNENQRLLRHPEKIVARAAKLLESPHFEDLAVGLGVTIGRRISELLDGHAKLEPATAWSVCFTGQRKHWGEREDFSFEIPTLAPAPAVLSAWRRLLVMLGDQVLDPQTINNRYGHTVNAAADLHFRGLVPPRLPPSPKPGREGLADDPHGRARRGDALYLHLFRAVYATVAVHWFCPPRVNRVVFKAEIQGHRQILNASTATMRRSYTAGRHYDDYQIADASGKNIDGRQGIKLGQLPGVEVLRVFQTPAHPPRPDAPTPLPPTRVVSSSVQHVPPTSPSLPIAMDPAALPAATHDVPTSAIPTPEPLPGQDDVDGGEPKAPREKRPRPVTYRIYPVDRPRLDAFRTDPKQSQADNLQGVIDLLKNASAAIQAQEQVQAQLREAQARAEQAMAERGQALQEVQDAHGRLQAQEEELHRLRQSLDQARTQAATAPAPAAGSGAPLALAVLARELLSFATEGECSPTFQARLITLATQALGANPFALEKRRETAPPSPTAKGSGEPRKRPRLAADPAHFGPLFAGEAARTAASTDHPLRGSAEDNPVAAPDILAEVTAPASEAVASAAETSIGDAQTPPATSDTSFAPSTPNRPIPRRGGAATKLGQALQAVLAHNQAQTTREKKWAVTESALARLTGCFRPAVRTFFAVNAQGIEAHNLQHHLSGGHNAARGKKGETIEEEVLWRWSE